MLQAVLEDEKRTTTHTLAEGEAELGREEAAHTEESERLKYAQDSVMPVKVCGAACCASLFPL